ncbi:integrase [Aquamicrobium defluvii]|nr:integrase [Aquamicrobium defluvii]
MEIRSQFRSPPRSRFRFYLRDLEEMMAERGIAVGHTTIHRWTVRCTPLLVARFKRRKRSVTGRWQMDEAYINVCGQWMYLCHAIDSVGDTVEFRFSEQRDLLSARRFFGKAPARHGRPDRIVIDGSQTNHEATVACDTTNRLRDRSRRRLKPRPCRGRCRWRMMRPGFLPRSRSRLPNQPRTCGASIRRRISISVRSGLLRRTGRVAMLDHSVRSRNLID